MEKFAGGIENMITNTLGALPKIGVGILILVIGSFIVKAILKGLGRRFEKRDMEKSLRGFLLSIIKVVLYILLILTAASTMGIQTTSFLTIFASAGLAIGLALQGSLSNFAGGVLILLFKPFKVGDYVSNTSGTEGTIDKIDLLYTTLTGPTGLKIFSPNGPLANSVITNYSDISSRRYDFVVGISYDTNIKTAQNVIQEALAKHKEVKQDPKPIIFVNNLADSSVNLNVRVWMDKANYWDTVFAIQQIVKNALDDANIEIPFPQRDIHVISDKEIK
ncbi:mechanosensitive ion channel family protein [Myroides odoratimimus]|uniref:mechanosensitive ion channel family protein n=1 Tax=Myroides odoratimimus TaxID=76832 RepID=UPI00257526F5|nr:mechanosensitive ion channel family protein [Myroides odoratimimus]MDM1509076.1 mechanosensitive ion channel family protein [Myroides odoratimimus]MDM1524434.1 mechanosensitive ion channel family protein [Myroides odoratimimus]MDM1677852.1 mechanosensitive ion channel family protein [Myroides odoratimimus]MEC4033636.1 mechanosensitive ion channel family protein [Myroides odoratimimus]MEC4092674.1 mechanosensitive ion channel family protein [Myroides odoratimimus]